MSRFLRPVVSLASGGDYWHASFRDRFGKRRRRCLGPKAKLSKRQANILCQRMAIEFAAQPGRIDAAKPPTLKEFFEAYLASRTDMAPRSKMVHDLVCRLITAHFGEQLRVDHITRADAAAWRTALAEGKLSHVSKGHSKALPNEVTLCNHARAAKRIFRHALDIDLIPINPFDRLRTTPPRIDRIWKHVSREEFEKLLANCPNDAWRAFLGVQRLAGLRRGEADRLTWGNIDLDHRMIVIVARKTKRKRATPINGRLRQILVAAKPSRVGSDTLVAPHSEVNRDNLIRKMTGIIKAAGFELWQDPFQVLRRSCATDLASMGLPQFAVSKWMGHGIEVSEEFYLQIVPELFKKASDMG